MANNLYYTVPDKYAGSTLQDLSNNNILPGIGPAKLTSAFSGIQANQPLQAGQVLTSTWDPNSGEAQSAAALFGTAMTPDQYNAYQTNQQNIQMNQPAISAAGSALTASQGAAGSAYSAYQGMEPTIQGSYQNILNTITKGVNSTYANRGLSNASPQYSLDLGNAQLPAANAEAGALNTFEQGLGNLLQGSAATASNFLNLIGGLKSGNPLQSIATGITEANQPFQQAQLAAQAALGSAQAGVAGYIPIPGLGIFNPTNQQLLSPYGNTTLGAGGGAAQIQMINGQPYINIP